MKYRFIYNEFSISSYTENIETSYTYTSSNVFIGTVQQAIDFFRKNNIDYSLLITDFSIVEKEIFNVDISMIEIDNVFYNRKISILSLPIDFSEEKIYAVLKKITDKPYVPDITKTYIIENEEFDYVYDQVINNNVPLLDIIKLKISIMDSENKFNI